MAVSTINAGRTAVSLGSTSRSSVYCATCGQSAAATSRVYSGGYSGRTGNDTYVCATCNRTGSATSTANNTVRTGTTYGNTSCATCGRTGSNYGSTSCPTCGTGSGYSSSWTGGYSSASSTGGKIYGTTSWAR